jgi:sugar phosphate isomerase/epimerase
VKLGIGSYAYAWSIGVPGYPAPSQPMDALGLVRRAAHYGVHLVQIADNLPLDALSESALDALLTESDRLGVSIEVGTRGIQPNHLRRYLGIAQRCRSPILRVVVDTRDHHPSPDEVVSLLNPLLPAFESAGVTLAIENHDRFKVRQLVDILYALDSPHVGICLDTVNSFGALEDPARVVGELGPHVVNLHVKDFRVRRVDHNMGFVVEGTPAGQGMLDLPWLLAALWGQAFNAILELWPAPEPTADATAAKEDDWVAMSIPYLRQFVVDGQ